MMIDQVTDSFASAFPKKLTLEQLQASMSQMANACILENGFTSRCTTMYVDAHDAKALMQVSQLLDMLAARRAALMKLLAEAPE